MDPMQDTLSASWLGKQRNPEPAPRPEPAETYTAKDENWYRIQAIYGEQAEPTPRPRRGRKTNG